MRLRRNPIASNEIDYKMADQPPWGQPFECTLEGGEVHAQMAIAKELPDGTVRFEVKPLVKPDSRVWARFIRLADASAERIRRFDKQYGSLGSRPDADLDPVETWRSYAKAARAITRTANCIRLRGGPGDPADWVTLSEFCL